MSVPAVFHTMYISVSVTMKCHVVAVQCLTLKMQFFQAELLIQDPGVITVKGFSSLCLSFSPMLLFMLLQNRVHF